MMFQYFLKCTRKNAFILIALNLRTPAFFNKNQIATGMVQNSCMECLLGMREVWDTY